MARCRSLACNPSILCSSAPLYTGYNNSRHSVWFFLREIAIYRLAPSDLETPGDDVASQWAVMLRTCLSDHLAVSLPIESHEIVHVTNLGFESHILGYAAVRKQTGQVHIEE
jgi:hypothetical protein